MDTKGGKLQGWGKKDSKTKTEKKKQQQENNKRNKRIPKQNQTIKNKANKNKK